MCETPGELLEELNKYTFITGHFEEDEICRILGKKEKLEDVERKKKEKEEQQNADILKALEEMRMPIDFEERYKDIDLIRGKYKKKAQETPIEDYEHATVLKPEKRVGEKLKKNKMEMKQNFQFNKVVSVYNAGGSIKPQKFAYNEKEFPILK